MLCRVCHRLVHHAGWEVRLGGGRAEFVPPALDRPATPPPPPTTPTHRLRLTSPHDVVASAKTFTSTNCPISTRVSWLSTSTTTSTRRAPATFQRSTTPPAFFGADDGRIDAGARRVRAGPGGGSGQCGADVGLLTLLLQHLGIAVRGVVAEDEPTGHLRRRRSRWDVSREEDEGRVAREFQDLRCRTRLSHPEGRPSQLEGQRLARLEVRPRGRPALARENRDLVSVTIDEDSVVQGECAAVESPRERRNLVRRVVRLRLRWQVGLPRSAQQTRKWSRQQVGGFVSCLAPRLGLRR